MSYKDEIIQRIENSCIDAELIDEIKQCSTNDEEILCILKRFYMNLQHQVDEACRHIDCIDYLIYEIEKKESDDSGR